MREIKFRVWDKEGNCFLIPNQKGYERTPWYTLSFNGEIMYSDNMGINLWGNKQNFVIQQFTGLKDIDSKEIYEGDILKIQVNGTIMLFCTGTYIAAIEWDNILCKFKLNISTKVDKYNRFNPDFYKDDGRTYEVIGNIFENPDLLNG